MNTKARFITILTLALLAGIALWATFTLAEHGITINHRTRQLLGRISIKDIQDTNTTLSWDGKEFETGLFVHMLEQRAMVSNLRLPEYDQAGRLTNNFQIRESQIRDRDAVWADLLDDDSDPDDVSPPPDIPPEIDNAWCSTLEAVRGEISKASFETWVAPARLVGWDDVRSELVVEVGTRASNNQNSGSNNERQEISPALC